MIDPSDRIEELTEALDNLCESAECLVGYCESTEGPCVVWRSDLRAAARFARTALAR